MYHVGISLVQLWNCFLAIKVPFSDFPPFDKELKGNTFNLVNHTTPQQFVDVVKMSVALFEPLDVFRSALLLSSTSWMFRKYT